VEALDSILWRIRFGRDYGHVVSQATERMTYIPVLVINQIDAQNFVFE